MPDGLVIIGAGGFGREVLDIIEAIEGTGRDLGFIGFLDDGEVNEEVLERRGARLLGRTRNFSKVADRFVVGIGAPELKARVTEVAREQYGRAETLIHPMASVGSATHLAQGCILAAGARVTTNVRLGQHVHVHVNATVGHDTVVNDFVTILPGATVGGDVLIDAETTIGAGANILNGISIAGGAFVGAGAVVTRPVSPGSTVIGVPARQVDSRLTGKPGESVS
jgi:sugar O-acyltransferase (sialic acid O-acetyltransferase NeuD family)